MEIFTEVALSDCVCRAVTLTHWKSLLLVTTHMMTPSAHGISTGMKQKVKSRETATRSTLPSLRHSKLTQMTFQTDYNTNSLILGAHQIFNTPKTKKKASA
jgi:hypothetical protein